MKTQKIFRLCLCFTMVLCYSSLNAQGIIVYQKDGTKVKYSYEEIDSIVTYNYGEEVENEIIKPSALMYTVNGVSFEMITIKGGTFTMGNESNEAWDSEKPAHQVTLNDYAIGMTEVTQELWQAVMGNNPSSFTGNQQFPVETISWDDCQDFIAKLNKLTGETFRLPTEAEWEYAARGGNASNGYKHSGSNVLDDVAWFCENSSGTTHPVKEKKANELGLYDMNGNVWEWCSDYFGYYTSSAVTNPQGPESSTWRVLRGGGWCDDMSYCRATGRGSNKPQYRYNLNGLRLAMTCEYKGEIENTDAPLSTDAIDLGLSVKWASCNIGATSPEEYGDYYAWGETVEKEIYDWSNYKWCNGVVYSMTKYCNDSYFGIIDNKTILELEDDAAYKKWGNSWRMPTLEEMNELKNNCDWTWASINGINGYRVTGANGNSIFLPAAGYRHGENSSGELSEGHYWSSTLCGICRHAECFYFYEEGYLGVSNNRDVALPVRPVTEK